MDEIKNDRSDLVGHPEQEAAAEARGLVPQALLHATDPRDTGDRRGHGQRGSLRGGGRQVPEAPQAIQSEAGLRGESGRELLLLLADGANIMCLI